MKCVILAGGMGSRLSEETDARPKPMVTIGDKPILWHIMKYYGHFGVNEFILCLGYKGYLIKEYFLHYNLHMSDVLIDLKKNEAIYQERLVEPWKVSLVETGADTNTGGRLKRIAKHVAGETFFMTYGDGVGNIDIEGLLKFHRNNQRLVTVTTTRPPSRFGSVDFDEKTGLVRSFWEKPKEHGDWINGGFFVMEPKALDYVDGDATAWENEPMRRLTTDGQLGAFKHAGFWQPMDTLREKRYLEEIWATGRAPWKVW